MSAKSPSASAPLPGRPLPSINEQTTLVQKAGGAKDYHTLVTTVDERTRSYNLWIQQTIFTIKNQLRMFVPQEERTFAILRVSWDEMRRQWSYVQNEHVIGGLMGEKLHSEDVPTSLDYKELALEMQDQMDMVNLFGTLCVILKEQKRYYHLSRTVYWYDTEAREDDTFAEKTMSGAVSQRGRAIFYGLYVNDHQTRIEAGPKWRENIRKARPKIPIPTRPLAAMNFGHWGDEDESSTTEEPAVLPQRGHQRAVSFSMSIRRAVDVPEMMGDSAPSSSRSDTAPSSSRSDGTVEETFLT